MKFLKFFLTIAIAAMGLFAVSCSSDDNKEEVKPTIVGTWETVSGDVEADRIGSRIAFNADGTFSITDTKGATIDKGTYNIVDKLLTMIFKYEEYDDEASSVVIEELTSTTLRVFSIDKELNKIQRATFKRIK